MMETFLFDVGSSTIKFCKYTDKKLIPLDKISILMKDNFSPEQGISPENKHQLFEFFKTQIQKYHLSTQNTKIFATGIFREMQDTTKQQFVQEFKQRTHLEFLIIDHNTENHYLEKARIGKYQGTDPIMIINIGGKTTELIIMHNNRAIEKRNSNVGVATILQQRPDINQEYSHIGLETLVEEIKKLLPEIESKAKICLYTGGELHYMQIANYNLQKNTIFADAEHPFLISIEHYQQDNEKIFSTIRLEELKNLMPENPNWMIGARACSALAQAICEKYGIENIIPSDANLLDGVIRTL